MSAGQQAVPANNANNASNEGAQKKHMSKAAVAIIAVVVVAIIVVAGVFGFRAYSDAQYNNAVAACAAASENVRNATNDYNNLVNGDASEAAALTKKDVKDASTLDALNKELSVELPVYEGCVADDTAGFKSATAKLNEQADWYKAYTQSLQKAVDAGTLPRSKRAQPHHCRQSRLAVAQGGFCYFAQSACCCNAAALIASNAGKFVLLFLRSFSLRVSR